MNIKFALALAAGLGGIMSSQGALLLYEGFDYAQNSNLDGATGGTGMTGTWTAAGSGDAAGGAVIQNSAISAEPADWNGTLVGNLSLLQTSGRFAGMGATGSDHNSGSRTLATTVSDTFVDGTSTWLSMVASRTLVTGHSKPALALGTTGLSQRAQWAEGPDSGDFTIGAGVNYNQSNGPIRAADWLDANSGGTLGGKNYSDGGVAQKMGGALGVNSQQLIVMRIDWAATDTVTVYNFGENDIGGLTEAIWNSATKSTHSVALDQSQIDTISFGGSRFHIDEIRLGTTFDDVVPLIPEPGTLSLFGAALGLATLRRRRH